MFGFTIGRILERLVIVGVLTRWMMVEDVTFRFVEKNVSLDLIEMISSSRHKPQTTIIVLDKDFFSEGDRRHIQSRLGIATTFCCNDKGGHEPYRYALLVARVLASLDLSF